MAVKLVGVLSGGLDSAVAVAAESRDRGISLSDETYLLNFNYGSRHNQFEMVAARNVAVRWGVSRYSTVNLYHAMSLAGTLAGSAESALMLGSSNAIPEGHYAEESMRQTVVPGRNLAFLSIAAASAEALARRYNQVVTLVVGIHQGDHHIYPDCRPDFFAAAKEAIRLSSEGRVEVVAPLLGLDKAAVVKLGIELQVPFELTRTCYANQELACGRCGSCNERLEAFAKNGIKDPIKYEEAK